MSDRFTTLKSDETTPTGIWSWARRLTNDLNKLRRVWALAELDLTGKAGHTVRVNATETGFEITP